MKKEEKSNTYLFLDKEEKRYIFRTGEDIEIAKELHARIQQSIKALGGPEAFRKKHIEQMAKDHECTPGEYELAEDIANKVFEFFDEFTKRGKQLTRDDILDFTNDLEWDIIDALRKHKGTQSD